MGSARERPERLAEKLLQIRTAFGVSQGEMLNRIGMGESGIDGCRNIINEDEVANDCTILVNGNALPFSGQTAEE